jgi:hypothetical protein
MQQLFTQRVEEQTDVHNRYENLNHLRFFSHTSGSVLKSAQIFLALLPTGPKDDGWYDEETSVHSYVRTDDARYYPLGRRISRHIHANGNGWNLVSS